jgi:hypothetical protein
MRHWTDPKTRGVYDHPAAAPPRPAHYAANDLAARLARQEEHTYYAAIDRVRIENESRMRAEDLAAGIDGLDTRISLMEQELHTRRAIWRLLATFSTSATAFAKYLAAAVLAILVLTGKASIDAARAIATWFGLPG